MKILLVSPLPPPYGGIANWSNLLLDFIKNHTDDTVKTINIAPKKRSTEGRTIFDRVVIGGLDMLKLSRKLNLELRSDKPDVIHITTSGSLAVFRDLLMMRIAKKHGVRVAYHIHFGKTEAMAKSGSKMWQFFSKAISTADAVMAIDNKTLEAIKKYVPDANVFFTPNPIDLSKLPKITNENKKQIVFLGWVVKPKGVDELVEAWNLVGKKFPDYELLVIGQSKPEYLSELKAKVSVDNITFTGEMAHDDAMNTLSKASCFILPSYTEGFPYSVLEAMCLKKAIIATDVGAIPQMLSRDCGMLIKPQSVDDIQFALTKLLSDDDLRNTLADNAYKKATSEYSAETVYDLYKSIWQTLY